MNLNSRKKLALILSAMSFVHAGALAQPTPIVVPGFLKFEVYTNITGTAVSDLLSSPNYPASPARVFYMPSFDTRIVYPDDSHDNYGGRLSGFITPTESGDYAFFLRSDEASQLFFSPDANPANLQLIAEETTCCGPFEDAGASETSFNHALVAGQRYAIEVLYKEGVGGDLCQVAWRKNEDSTPAAQLTPIPAAFLSTLIAPRGGITITSQPATATAGQNEFITLNVGFTVTHGPAVVQWQKNGTNVPGLTGSTAKLGPLNGTEGGSYRAVVSIPGAVTNSAPATITVTPDVTPPTIKSVVGSDTFTSLTVEFSEAVLADGAGDEFNYALDGGLNITAVTVLSPTSARLTTSPQTPGATYILTIQNIVDMDNLMSAPGTSRSFTALTQVAGGVKFEAWLGIGGNAVSALLADPRYPASPDVAAYATRFTSREVFADAASMNDYGGRLSGWIVAPETAQYEFFVRSDDDSELSLSTDADPANATVIAMGVCCGAFAEPPNAATSMPISLTMGNRYYIRALWKEGGGGDYCDVAWRKVGDATAALNLPFIPGTVLETYAVPGTFTAPTVTFSNPANGATFESSDAVTLTAGASAASSKSLVRVEFLEQGRVIGTVSNSPYSLTLYDVREDNHTYLARATDSAGLFTDSTPITISVGAQVATVKLAAIDTVTQWRYDRSGSDLMTDWRQSGYDDSTWPSGPALIADEGTTTVEPIRTRISRFNDMGAYVRTFYYRTHFNFDSPVSPTVKLKLRHVVDDGVVVYLNGTEIHRFGIAAGDVNYLTDATGHENVYEGPYDIPTDNLLQGDNVLAAEVHQAGGGSSDMVFGAELIATVPVIRPTLTMTRNGASLNISWTPAGGALESAPTVTGPWSAVSNATNPYMTTANQAALFYRVNR